MATGGSIELHSSVLYAEMLRRDPVSLLLMKHKGTETFPHKEGSFLQLLKVTSIHEP